MTTTPSSIAEALPKGDTLRLQDVLTSMTPDQYQQWVYSKEASNSFARVEIFPPVADQLLTQMNSTARLLWALVWALVCIWISPADLSPKGALVVGLGYYFLWPSIEVAMHRYVFHMTVTTRLQMVVHFVLHGLHHVAPTDLTHLMLPLSAGLPIAGCVWYILRVLTYADTANLLMVGIILGYVRYDITHFCIHSYSTAGQFEKSIGYVRLPKWALSKFTRLRENHRLHHFVSPHTHFNVSFEEPQTPTCDE